MSDLFGLGGGGRGAGRLVDVPACDSFSPSKDEASARITYTSPTTSSVGGNAEYVNELLEMVWWCKGETPGGEGSRGYVADFCVPCFFPAFRGQRQCGGSHIHCMHFIENLNRATDSQ